MARIGSAQTIVSWANTAAFPSGTSGPGTANHGTKFEPTPHGGIIVDWAVDAAASLSGVTLDWEVSSDDGTTWYALERISTNNNTQGPMHITLDHTAAASEEWGIPFCIDGTDASPRASAPLCWEYMRPVVTVAGTAMGTATSVSIWWCPVIDD